MNMQLSNGGDKLASVSNYSVKAYKVRRALIINPDKLESAGEYFSQRFARERWAGRNGVYLFISRNMNSYIIHEDHPEIDEVLVRRINWLVGFYKNVCSSNDGIKRQIISAGEIVDDMEVHIQNFDFEAHILNIGFDGSADIDCSDEGCVDSAWK